MNILNVFRKPTLKAKLLRGGRMVKVDLIRVSSGNAILLLFSVVKQVAIYLKIDRRFLLNKLVDLDKQIERTAKQESKKGKYNK